MKVVVGMSGGVDSTVAAYILKEKGYDVYGVTMCVDTKSENVKKDIEDAKKICEKFSIPHEVINVEDDFKKVIIDRFVNDYIKGLTPPPCNICNGKIKFKMLEEYMEKINADKIATGHYANVLKNDVNGRYYINKSKNIKKDQSYMLYSLTQDEMKNLILPIGNMEKDDIREIAKNLRLDVSVKKDSQDICFIKNIDYKEFIKRYFLGEDYQYKLAKGELTEDEILEKCPFLRGGKYVDENNNILGYHDGIINYTKGQRKGLNIAFGERKFVLDVDAEKNEVLLGDNEKLFDDNIEIDIDNDTVWQKIDKLDEDEKIECTVKVRYRDTYHQCIVYAKNNKLYVKSSEKIRAITKGQVAVFFDEDDILFGGIIRK